MKGKEGFFNNSFQLVMILIGVFLISFSGLMLEITLTRIFSTTIWYHYAFVAISVALFGWGLGGLFLHFRGQRFRQEALRISAIVALIFSLSISAYVWGILQFPLSPDYLPVYLIVSTVPFFFGGVCMALLFDHFTYLANKIYFGDLAGASFGCISVEPTLTLLGAESTVLMLGVTASVAGLFFSIASRKRGLIAISIIGLMVTSSIFVNNVQNQSISISNAPSKLMFRLLEANPELKLVLTKWNSFSRIDVVEGPFENDVAHIFIDADATTEVLEWNGTVEDAQYLKQTIDFLPYYVVEEPKALIIGSGGGRDVIISLVGESSKVVAVELNPIIIEATKNYGENAGNVYDRDGVEVVVDEGRSFISRSNEKYDVIVLTLVDSWASIMAGGYALAENYLYTIEAFQQYFAHLTEDGVLVMIRWDWEIPRLVSTAAVALQARGETITEAGKHIAIILEKLETEIFRTLFIFKNTPFNVSQAEKIRDQALELGSNCQLYYLPYFYNTTQPYASLFDGAISLDQFHAVFSARTEPVTDDDPYYFCVERPIPETLRNLFTVTLLLAFVFFAVPWIAKRQQKTKHASGLFSFVIFFSALGLGYMLLEVALIQKFILFLGYPTRALSVILFSLLLSSGIGSFVSGWASERKLVKNVLLACPVIIIIVTCYVFSLPSLFAIWLSQDSAVRMLVTVLLLFPLGFLMGIPFPTGLRILSSSNQSVPWMWGINGAMSVLGSVLVTVIGITYGFSYAMILGAFAYFIALLCAWYWRGRID
ncbi:MAG: spermidine synthase [Candidatus Bathyarchaeota archaeon BA2]|nr:MAG: spermidine synthase [Candidatus Bathyarchaeota archaeon BA2]